MKKIEKSIKELETLINYKLSNSEKALYKVGYYKGKVDQLISYMVWNVFVILFAVIFVTVLLVLFH